MDRWSGLGLLVVATAGATLSCTSLAGLARACGYGPHLAWLMPVSIDAYALVAMRVWLCSGADRRVVAWAAASGWLAIAASVAGNATYHAIETGRGAQLVTGQWQAGIAIVVLVGAAPAVFVGAAVTLLHLAQPPAAAASKDCPAEQAAADAVPPRIERPTTPVPALPTAVNGQTTADGFLDRPWGLIGVGGPGTCGSVWSGSSRAPSEVPSLAMPGSLPG